MARVKKPQPTLETVFFSTPEQKVVRFLLLEPTTTFTSRVISSKLKGLRGVGGPEGIDLILKDLSIAGLIEYVDNGRAVRLREECCGVKVLQKFSALCDLESLKSVLEPVSTRGILHGARAKGEVTSDSAYELVVVSELPVEVKKLTSRHPLAKRLEMMTVTPDDFLSLDRKQPILAGKLAQGIVVWGPTW